MLISRKKTATRSRVVRIAEAYKKAVSAMNLAKVAIVLAAVSLAFSAVTLLHDRSTEQPVEEVGE